MRNFFILSKFKVIVLLTTIMTILKLSGAITISWWLVTLPLWISMATALAFFVVALASAIIILIIASTVS